MKKPKLIHYASNLHVCVPNFLKIKNKNSTLNKDEVTCKKCLSLIEQIVYLTYSEYYTGGEICEGQENDNFPSYEDEYIDFSLEHAFINRPGGLFLIEEIETKFKIKNDMDIYVVVVRHGDGNTFGHINGCWFIEGVYDNEEQAKKIESSIGNNTYEGSRRPWEGYFASLESISIQMLTVKEIKT